MARPRGRRTKTRHHGSRRRHLARLLHALRSRIYRPGTEDLTDHRQSVRHEIVTHVLGTNRYLCLRAVHEEYGGPGGTRTPNQAVMSERAGHFIAKHTAALPYKNCCDLLRLANPSVT